MTTQTPNVSREDAVRIDTRLSELWAEVYRIEDSLTPTIQTMHQYLGHPAKYTRSGTRFQATTEQAVAGAREVATGQRVLARGSWATDPNEGIVRALAKHDERLAQIAALKAEAEPLEAVFRANPWSRFWLVKNNGGHIHSSRACKTTYVTTRFGWLPALSGLTEKDAVDAHGAILCSICFPSAPVEWTDGKKADDGTCPGSGEAPDPNKDRRKGYAAGNWGHCVVCGAQQPVSQRGFGKIRKHKAPTA